MIQSKLTTLALLPAAVLSVRVSGVLTIAVWSQLGVELLAVCRSQNIAALTVDFRSSVIAFDQTYAVARTGTDGEFIRVPVSMLVGSSSLSMFARHARSMAQRGVARRIFIGDDLAGARDWALRQAALDPCRLD
jgi:hypothetical protein